MFLFCVLWKENEQSKKLHACPRTTPKYKSSAEHLSCLCIWSFLPLSSIQLTTGCWKVLSAISLSVITTVALCFDPGLNWRARGHVPFHNAASSPFTGAHYDFVKDGVCFAVIFLFFVVFLFFFLLVAVSDRKRLNKEERAGDIWHGFSAKLCQVKNVTSASQLMSEKLNLLSMKSVQTFVSGPLVSYWQIMLLSDPSL